MARRTHTLWTFMKGHRRRYLLAIGALIVATLISYMPPLVIGAVIDNVIDGKPLRGPEWLTGLFDAIGGRTVLGSNLWIGGLAIVALMAGSGVFLYVKGRYAAHAAEGISRNIRETVYNHLQNLPVSFHDESDTGDLVQRCTSDIDTIHVFLSLQVVEIGRGAALIATALPIMLYLNVWMTGVSMVLIPVILIFTVWFFIQVRGAFKRSDEAEGKMTARLQENLTGIRVVRAFARQEHECALFARRNATWRDLDYRLIRLLGVYWSLSDLLCFAQRGLVLFAGAWLVSRGEMKIGQMVVFFMFVDRFLWPIRRLGRVLTDLGKATVSIDRLGEILENEPETTTEGDVPDLDVAGEIEFRNVSFAFTPTGMGVRKSDDDTPPSDGSPDRESDAPPVLRDVSFHVGPGATLAILGPSGSGKSTIVNLLLRLYNYEQGEILLDGRELHELDAQAVRNQIGVILQEPFLYSRSVRENVKLGRSAASDEEMIEATTAACVHDSIQSFEEGYDTKVGERGVTLSGGQRQRVALARAILNDPPILVLDDALSAVDTRTEKMVLDALQDRRGRHTTLIIAHRISTLMHADEIIVLEHGRVVQTGSHEQLLNQPGLYRRLWDIQNSLEADLDEDLQAANT
ncbi:MAG: ABC transporter ATP-binding protein [Phycisphaerae bacterium]